MLIRHLLKSSENVDVWFMREHLVQNPGALLQYTHYLIPIEVNTNALN
jgi:hypothetical protein